MKASELIKFALVNSFYVRPDNSQHGKTSEYMCHALEYCVKHLPVEINDTLQEETRSYIMDEFNNSCLTLFTYLARHDKKYKNYVERWGHASKACFNLRVKWFESLILKLESKGL